MAAPCSATPKRVSFTTFVRRPFKDDTQYFTFLTDSDGVGHFYCHGNALRRDKRQITCQDESATVWPLLPKRRPRRLILFVEKDCIDGHRHPLFGHFMRSIVGAHCRQQCRGSHFPENAPNCASQSSALFHDIVLKRYDTVMGSNTKCKSRHKGSRLAGVFRRRPADETAEAQFAVCHWPNCVQRPHCGACNAQAGAMHKTMPCLCREKKYTKCHLPRPAGLWKIRSGACGSGRQRPVWLRRTSNRSPACSRIVT